MPYKMNDKQFESVQSLESNSRLKHFISKVADWEQLWAVKSEEGWLVPVAPEGFEYFPVWPHPEYAQKITDLNFPNHIAEKIPLAEFLSHWLPLLQEDGVKVAVFPNKEWTFWCVEAEDLMTELVEELKLYS